MKKILTLMTILCFVCTTNSFATSRDDERRNRNRNGDVDIRNRNDNDIDIRNRINTDNSVRNRNNVRNNISNYSNDYNSDYNYDYNTDYNYDYNNNSDYNNNYNSQGQSQDQKAVAKQAQGQLQSANNEGINIGGDSYESNYLAPPPVNGEIGTVAGQITTPFVGFGFEHTDAYKVAIEKAQALSYMVEAKLITLEEAQKEAKVVLKTLSKASCRDRILGFLPSSKSPLFQLISFENCETVKSEKKSPKVVDKEVNGNSGNF